MNGSIGDGPVLGATVVISDRKGKVIQSEDIASTNYSITLHVPGGTESYPLTIQAQGGTDLVSNAFPDLPLLSVALSPSTTTVNINPFSTLIVKTALAMPNGVTEENIAAARSAVLNELNFGFDTTLLDDPITLVVTDSNAAMITKAGEALAEMVRRTRDTLLVQGSSLTADDVMTSLAADLSDGSLDGSGANNADPRISATAKVVSAQVLLEALTNNLKVGGIDATTALNNAILFSFPDAPLAVTELVPIGAEMIDQAMGAVNAALSIAPSVALSDIQAKLTQLTPGSLASEIRSILPPESAAELDVAIAQMPTASESDIAAINDAAVPNLNSAPNISGSPAGAVTAGNAYSFQPSASDADSDNLSFSIANKPAWASFSTSTGRLSGTPASNQVGTYSGIAIAVSDGQDTASLPAFSITVSGAPNHAPTISGSPAGAVTAGNAYSFQPAASDADGDNLSFSIANKPAWTSFNTTTGRLSGTPTSNRVGTYSGITISVTDGHDTTSLPDFSITVSGLPNRAPTISGSPAGTVTAGSAYSFQPTASDADGDSLTFSIANKPAWASFNTTTGRLSGTPSSGQVGTYAGITITASDGQDSATLPAFSISVEANIPATGSASLSWVAPTSKADGSPLSLSEIAGYRIYHGTTSSNLMLLHDLSDGSATNYTVNALEPATHYFAVTTYDYYGNESGYSEIGNKTIP